MELTGLLLKLDRRNDKLTYNTHAGSKNDEIDSFSGQSWGKELWN